MCTTVAMGWSKSELLTVPFLEVTENPYTKTHCRTQIPSKRLTENVKCRKCFGSVIKFFFFISFEFVSIVFVMVGVKGYLDKQVTREEKILFLWSMSFPIIVIDIVNWPP